MKAGDLEPGDVIAFPHVGERVVRAVDREGDRVRLSVFQHSSTSYENKASAPRGVRLDLDRLVVRWLRPFDAGERVDARKGSPARAAELDAELVEQDALYLQRMGRSTRRRD